MRTSRRSVPVPADELPESKPLMNDIDDRLDAEFPSLFGFGVTVQSRGPAWRPDADDFCMDE